MRSWHSPAGAESAPVPLPAPLPMPSSGRAVLPRANVTALTPCGGVRCGPRPGRTLGSGWEPPPLSLQLGNPPVWGRVGEWHPPPCQPSSLCQPVRFLFQMSVLLLGSRRKSAFTASAVPMPQQPGRLPGFPGLLPNRGSSRAGLHRLKPFAFVPSSFRMGH